MKLIDIEPAIESVAASPAITDLRERTYLATYPGYDIDWCDEGSHE